MASTGNQHSSSCIGTLSFPIRSLRCELQVFYTMSYFPYWTIGRGTYKTQGQKWLTRWQHQTGYGLWCLRLPCRITTSWCHKRLPAVTYYNADIATENGVRFVATQLSKRCTHTISRKLHPLQADQTWVICYRLFHLIVLFFPGWTVGVGAGQGCLARTCCRVVWYLFISKTTNDKRKYWKKEKEKNKKEKTPKNESYTEVNDSKKWQVWPISGLTYSCPTRTRGGRDSTFSKSSDSRLAKVLTTDSRGIYIKVKKVAHTRLPSLGFRSWSVYFAVSLQVTWVINPAVGCHYFPPGLQLPPQPLRGLLPILLLGEERHDGCEQFA